MAQSVRALASHQCGPGSNPCVDAICGLSLLLVLSLALRGFTRVLRFSPLLKNQHFQLKFQFNQESGTQRTTMWMCCLKIVLQILDVFFSTVSGYKIKQSDVFSRRLT